MRRLFFILHPSAFILLLVATCCSSCGLASVVGKGFEPNVKAMYSGLAGQSVGVLVWADRGIMIDWGTIQLDLANSVQSQLVASKTDETKGMTSPYPPASYVKFMRDHPGLESAPITEIAPKFGVSRVIYIEVQNFRTRSQRELELFRGEATMSLKIIEVDPSGGTRTAFTEDNIKAVFPDWAPPDGVPSIGDNKTYVGTKEAMATEIVNRLLAHESAPARGN
ncbi:MAG: hypothetical protein H7Z14_09860 [Anaerolineae bacterium]|nr:hypothetical protein [Phycisphaerae bacterium]